MKNQTSTRLEMGSPIGQPTNNQRKRDQVFKTIPFSMEGKTLVRDTTAKVNTWKIVKK